MERVGIKVGMSRYALAMVMAAVLVGCGVPQEDLDSALADLAEAKDRLAEIEDELDTIRSESDDRATAIEELESERDSVLTDLARAESDVEAARADVDAAESERDGALEAARSEAAEELEGQRADLAASEAAFAGRVEATEAALADRESAVAAVESSQFTDGTYLVGTDVPAGQYRSDGTGSGCYWERLTNDGEDIINNHFGAAPAIATIRDGEIFRVNDCGTWRPIGG